MTPAKNSANLSELEEIIAQGFRSFVAVGEALAEIQKKQLYKPKYKTFEDYCAKTWQMCRARAYQLINASATATVLSTIVDTVQPTAESQIRPLVGKDKHTKLQPADQKKTWKAACKTAGTGKVPTAAIVARTVKELYPPPPPEPAADPIPEHAAVLEELRLRRHNHGPTGP